MGSDDSNSDLTLDEVYAKIDQDRIAAAVLAEASFRLDVGVAITSISDVTSIACAKVSADSQVASAKMLVDAEVAVARLSNEAGTMVAEFRVFLQEHPEREQSEVVKNMVAEIEGKYEAKISETAKASIDAIRADSVAAIAKLKSIGEAAIKDINDLGETAATKAKTDAALAEEKTKHFRSERHTPEEAVAEGEAAAKLVKKAADIAHVVLRQAVDDAMLRIRTATDEASRIIQAAAETAEQRIKAAEANAIHIMREVQGFHMEG